MPSYTPNRNYAKPNVNDPVDADLWGDQLNDNFDALDTDVQTALDGLGAIPSGAIFDYAGSSAPSGYLLCFGQDVDRTTYADLFAAIGTVYGSGDGSTTFGLPDLRGRAVAGKDDMGGTSANRLTSALNGDTLGASGGSETHTLSVGEMPAHTHSFNTGTGSPGATGGVTGVGSNVANTGSTGGGGAHNNTQPTFILNKIIKT